MISNKFTFWAVLAILSGGILGHFVDLAAVMPSTDSTAMASNKSAENAAAPTPQAAPLPNRIVGPGRIEPDQGEVDITSEIPGIIEELSVREGDKIIKGQVLGHLRNGDLDAKVKEAQAALEIKRQALDKLKTGPRSDEIKQAEANLNEIKSQQSLAVLQLSRQNQLKASGYATPANLDTANANLNQATARRASAEAALALLKKGARAEDVKAAEADVALAQAQLDIATATLNKSLIIAPFDGTVLRRYRDPGAAIAGPGATPIIQVGDLANLVVRTQIDETDIGEVKVGNSAEIRVPAFPKEKFDGHVIRVSPRLGAKTISADLPTEKRDARVLDVIVKLDGQKTLPIGLRVDSYINTASQ